MTASLFPSSATPPKNSVPQPRQASTAGSNIASPIIRLESVKRTYHVGDVDMHALRDVSRTVNAGEFVAIMGSSGFGKSTLKPIICCLDRPTNGRYFFEGADVAGLEEPDRARLRSERLGFVFQSFNLLARTSAIENVAQRPFYAAAAPAGASSRTLAYFFRNRTPSPECSDPAKNSMPYTSSNTRCNS